jgi:hypothetical protein
MRPIQVFFAALAAHQAQAYLVAPPGTPAPGATEDCSAWVQQSYDLTCDTIEEYFGMTAAEFEAWVSGFLGLFWRY